VYEPQRRAQLIIASNPVAIKLCANSDVHERLLFTPVDRPVDSNRWLGKRIDGGTFRVFGTLFRAIAGEERFASFDRDRRADEKRKRLHGLELRR